MSGSWLESFKESFAINGLKDKYLDPDFEAILKDLEHFYFLFVNTIDISYSLAIPLPFPLFTIER